MSMSLRDKLEPQYKAIHDEMIEESQFVDAETQQRIGQKYLEYQLSWFNRVYCEEDDITFADKDKAKKELIAFLESYVTDKRQLSKEDQESFRKDFTRLYDAAFGREDRNLNRDYGIRKMNVLLAKQKLCYEVVSQSSYWEVRKCCEEDLE